MGRPKDLPPAPAYKHGTRARYVAGCRCRPCTQSNVQAYHVREAEAKAAAAELGTERTETHCVGVHGRPCPHGTKLRKDSTGNICMQCRKMLVWNGLVPAKEARHHLLILSNAGIGYKSVADAASVAHSVVAKIVNGRRKKIRARTSKAILEVDKLAIADHGLVDARPAWRMVHGLIRDHGFTKAEIARRLGYMRPALQLGKKRMTARNALRIAKMLRDAEGDFL